MMNITRFGRYAAIAATLLITTPNGALAFNFARTVTVTPLVMETFVKGDTHSDTSTCTFFSCFITTGLIPDSAAAVLLNPFTDRVAIGYDFFFNPGTQPCACQSFGLVGMSGGASFRTLDIPDNFATATLVLTPTHTDKIAANKPSLLTGLFETSGNTVTFTDPTATTLVHSFDRPFFSFDARHDTWTFITGHVGNETATVYPKEVNLSSPVFSPFPANPNTTSQPVQLDANGTYRINVSNTVRNWIANWPSRLNTPIHNFVITGQEFTPDAIQQASNGFTEGTFLVQYNVELEFFILEPDL